MNKPTILFLSSLLAIAPCSAFAMAATTAATEASSTETSPTEGTVTSAFVDESTMQSDMLQMLANFATYLKSDFQNAVAPNSVGEACGCFKSNNTMKNNEDGVRSNADLSMVTAFLVKYGKGKVTLPSGVTWDELDTIARRSLIFAYSTHKANKLKVCAGNNYWGSTGTSDYTWESSLWAMSVAYSAFSSGTILPHHSVITLRICSRPNVTTSLTALSLQATPATPRPKRTAGKPMCWQPRWASFPTMS